MTGKGNAAESRDGGKRKRNTDTPPRKIAVTKDISEYKKSACVGADESVSYASGFLLFKEKENAFSC